MGDETLAQRAMRVLGKDGLSKAGTLRSEIVQYRDRRLDDGHCDGADGATLPRPARRRRPPASALKLFGTELNERRSELLMAIEEDDGLTSGSAAARDWLSAPSTTIAGE
ncbi:hypothetical protein AB5I41_14530 [Sphingomonas sp. MMS24-JH45]